ncbi:MAG: phosphate ABC transporter permease PstA [Gammaproteobacteria bacterium]
MSEATKAVKKSLTRRYRKEKIFRAVGMTAILVGLSFVVILFTNIISKGYPAFQQTYIKLPIHFDEQVIDPKGERDPEAMRRADYMGLIKESLREAFPDVKGRSDKRDLYNLVSKGAAYELADMVLADTGLIGQTRELWLLADDEIDTLVKGYVTNSETFPLAGEPAVFENDGVLRITGGTATTESLHNLLQNLVPAETGGEKDVVTLPDDAASLLLEVQGGLVRVTGFDASGVTGKVLSPLSPDAAGAGWTLVWHETPEAERRVKDKTIFWVRTLESRGSVEKHFNTVFFTSGDSREPEQSGIAGALAGSMLTLIVTLLLSFPIGVGAAIYLEEFAPRNRWTDLIEVNINNLAAVPSIVFGLLGLAVFISFFGLPRSAPLVGGLVLTLMTLPTIIIASRAALKSVPPSIKEAALGVGASKMQAMFHHVLPLALPGMLTGTIIGMAQALGETAPLLMIGMVAFIVDIPQGFTDNATVLPVQIFLWADSPERAFVERTSAAIMVLLAFLIAMNALAVFLRKKFERKW